MQLNPPMMSSKGITVCLSSEQSTTPFYHASLSMVRAAG